MAYKRIEVQNDKTVVDKTLIDNLQDGIDEALGGLKEVKEMPLVAEVDEENETYRVSTIDAEAEGKASVALIENAKAIGDYSVAIGNNTRAGCKGYFFKAIDPIKKKIFLTNTQPTRENPPIMLEEGYDENSYIEEDFETPPYNVTTNNEIAIIVSTYFAFFDCFLKSVDKNIVTYEGDLPFNEIGIGDASSYRYTISVPQQPDIGNTMVGYASFAEGYETFASGRYAHAEGYKTIAFAYGHAEGNCTKAGGSAHAEGQLTVARGLQSHAEGYGSLAIGDNSHAEGFKTKSIGTSSHAENHSTEAHGNASHAEGYSTKVFGNYSHIEGVNNSAYGECSHIEGRNNVVYSNYSHIEGQGHNISKLIINGEVVTADNIHIEGYEHTIQTGTDSKGNSIVPNYTHLEGMRNIVGAKAQRSHTEGQNCENYAELSHIEGYGCKAEATASYSHTEGRGTISKGMYQHTQGKWNKPLDNSYAHIVGNGTSDENRSNAYTLDWNGNAWYAGGITLGDEKQKVATEEYVSNAIKSAGGIGGNTGDEDISGVKNFVDGIKTGNIYSDYGVTIGGDGPAVIYGVGASLELYDDANFTLGSGFGGVIKVNNKPVALKEDIAPVVLSEVSTHNSNTQSHGDIREKLSTVEAIAEGASVSETFENYNEMVSAINNANSEAYRKGRNINIVTINVPDLWVAYVSDTSTPYTYTTDEAFVEELQTSGSVQVGYYKLAMLETQKVDLKDYAKKEEVNSALNGCVIKKVTEEEYDSMFSEGTLEADTIYFVGGSANVS